MLKTNDWLQSLGLISCPALKNKSLKGDALKSAVLKHIDRGIKTATDLAQVTSKPRRAINKTLEALMIERKVKRRNISPPNRAPSFEYYLN